MTDRRVVVFRKDILPISETFIPAQVQALVRWSPTFVGFQQVKGLETRQLSPTILYDVARPIERAALKRDQFLPFFNVSGRRVKALLTKQMPDLIHAHFGYDAILVSDAAQELNIPLVVTLHGTDVLRDWRAWASGHDGFFFRFYPAKIRQLFSNPNVYFVAVSEALRQTAIQQGAPAARTSVIYTGIDIARFANVVRRPPPRPTVLFLGRLVEFKGCEYLIRSMAEVQLRLPQAQLVIAGDGPLRPELEKLADQIGVEAQFLGRVEPREVTRLLSQATLFCLPSVTDRDGGYEAFGMVMLEAQAAGVPVVTSAPAGVEAVVPGKTGFIFPERDIEELSRILVNVLSADLADLYALSDAARAHVARIFNAATCAISLEDYYDRIALSR